MELVTLIPVLILLATGVAIGVLGAGSRGLAWIGIVGAAAALLRLHGYRLSGWVDSDSHCQFLGLVVIVLLGLALPSMSTFQRQQGIDEARRRNSTILLLLSSAGMLLMVSTRNLIVILLSLELVSFGVYVSSRWAWTGEGTRLFGARWKERLMRYYSTGTGLAIAPTLLGLVLIYGDLGCFDLAGMEIELAAREYGAGLLSVAALGFLLAGLVWKMVALAVRLAARGEEAPTMMTGYLAVAVQVSLFGVLLRMTGWLLVLTDYWKALFFVVAVVIMSLASLVALAQDDIRRMLAFSGLSHLGTLFLGVAVGGWLGRSAVLFYLLAFSFSNLGAYTVAIALVGGSGQNRLIRHWRGLGWKFPISGLAMSIFMLSLAGIPPSVVFMGKFYLFSAAVSEGYLVPVIVGLGATLVSAYCYLKVVVQLYMEAPTAEHETLLLDRPLAISLVVSSVAVFLAGFFPERWLSLAKRVALEFF